MKVKDGAWRYASRDLFKVTCRHCTTLEMAVAAKVPEALEIHEAYAEDLNMVLPVRQGLEYEAMVFDWLRAELGEGFIELERASMEDTLGHLKAGVPVVAQGFFESWTNGHFWSGYADLLVREDYDVVGTAEGKITIVKSDRILDTPRYVVWDVKCSKNFKKYYWIQLASYAEILHQHSLGSDLDLGIIGVRGVTARHALNLGLQSLNGSRDALFELLDSINPDDMTFSQVASMHCENKGVCEDLHCPYPKHCKIGVLAEDPLSQIYDFRSLAAYQAAGFRTLHQLASSDGPLFVGKLSQEKINEHRLWAKVVEKERLTGQPQIDILDQAMWLPLPEKDSSDLFFDIEWFTPVNAESDSVFMFGAVDADEQFTVFESLDLTSEKDLFEKFVAYALDKMKSSAAAHIYHYYNPEPRYLKNLASDYEILADEVDFLVSRMVDLRDIAKSRVRPGAGGYSIKQLERYYDADTNLNRKGLVAGGDQALLYFDLAKKAQDLGDESEAARLLKVITDYNRDDCLSTKLLRDWLRDPSTKAKKSE
jgi:predicted RecB family nuclease